MVRLMAMLALLGGLSTSMASAAVQVRREGGKLQIVAARLCVECDGFPAVVTFMAGAEGDAVLSGPGGFSVQALAFKPLFSEPMARPKVADKPESPQWAWPACR